MMVNRDLKGLPSISQHNSRKCAVLCGTMNASAVKRLPGWRTVAGHRERHTMSGSHAAATVSVRA